VYNGEMMSADRENQPLNFVARPLDCLLQLDHVVKEYGSGETGVKAVKDASLIIQPGEFVLLQGPSGSGKTTLLSIMGCLMKPSSGRVQLMGQDVTFLGERDLPELRRRHIGFIFQTFNLFPALTGEQNVELALRLKGLRRKYRKKEAQRLLTLMGLKDCMHRKPGDLSGGQRQRISIARALAGDVDILLADEPTAALDTNTGLGIMELLKEETRSGRRAAFVVTHDPRLSRFATRVDTIIDGELRVNAQALQPAAPS
jgi:putative ABC transport system ATP-binding protein